MDYFSPTEAQDWKPGYTSEFIRKARDNQKAQQKTLRDSSEARRERLRKRRKKMDLIEKHRKELAFIKFNRLAFEAERSRFQAERDQIEAERREVEAIKASLLACIEA